MEFILKTLFKKIKRKLKYYFTFIYSDQVKFVFDPDYLKKYVNYRWPLPDGFHLCNYNPSINLNEWAALLNEEGHFGEWDKDKVQKEIVNRLCEPDTATFLFYHDQMIGCCSALDNSTRNRKIMCGMWLYLKPEFTYYKTFAVALTLNTAVFSLKYKYDEASGYTDTHRLPAICLYLMNGASPAYVSLSDFWQWYHILKRLKPLLNRHFKRLKTKNQKVETLIESTPTVLLTERKKNQIIRLMDNYSSLKFYGSFEVFQDDKFVEIFRKYYSWKLLSVSGVKIFMGFSRFIGYTEGIIGSPDKVALHDVWWPEIKKLNCTFLTIHTLENIPEFKPYCITKPDNANLFIDLSLGEEKLLKNFEQRCRTAIKAGIKKGVRIHEAQSEEDMLKFYQLVLKMSDNGKKYDILQYELMKDLIAAQCGVLLVGIVEDKVIGGNFIVLSKTNALGWMAALDRDYTSYTPGNLIMFEGIKWCIRNNLHFFDFGQQSLTENKQLLQYKMSFNPLIRSAYTYKIPMNIRKVNISKMRDMLFKHK